MKYAIALISFGLSLGAIHSRAQSKTLLWYDGPAEYFEQSLVLGNGKMGASVFGGVASDKIYLNDATLWSGEPVDPNMNPTAHKSIPSIREALKKGDNKLADSLIRKVQGKYSESYTPLGTMVLDFEHAGKPKDYYRELNLEKGISTVKYEVDGVAFQREYFISYPDSIMAIHLTSNKKGSLNFDLTFDSKLQYAVSASGNNLAVHGRAPYYAAPNYVDEPSPVRFDKNRGTRFTALFRVVDTDGKVHVSNGALHLENGSRATLLVSVASSFNGFDKNPATEGVDDRKLAQIKLESASKKSTNSLREAHVADHRNFFDRVHLDLGETAAPNLPTDDRLRRYAKGEEDKNLEILYFQFGRYLLIASSRTPGVPANLQGIWNPHLRPPWSSNYTLNINAEENYWLAENANLSEMHLPLLGFIRNIAETGTVTAKTFYGVGGWSAAHNSDIWAMSNPVGNFGQGGPVWANWNMGGTWLVTHLWEHYQFTRDLDFLSQQGYPLMKGAAQFCLEWLTEDAQGNLITAPSTSPENEFITPEGYKGAVLAGATSDLAMIRECFQQTLEAAKVLGRDPEFQQQLERALQKLYPYQIGKKGNLQEWYEDWEDADPQHRHQSHLFGLYPGHHINPETTPALASASRRTLEIKGDETTGWSKGWRINLWARLWDGNRAYKMYRELLKYVEPDGVKTDYARGGGTYPNLFDAHPPFQIDGNFGGAAAVIEMLLQSGNGDIRLLPALPDAWPTGSVKGIRARGGYELDLTWDKGVIRNISITATNAGPVNLIHGKEQKKVTFKNGERKKITWE
ncbi:MAG: glycoside hydrolase family 95 protein [Sediminicola sp.]